MLNLGDVEMQREDIEEVENEVERQEVEHQFSGSFKKEDFAKTLNILKRAKSLIDEDGMWIGLRKHQLDIKLVVVDVVQKHVHTSKVVGGVI